MERELNLVNHDTIGCEKGRTERPAGACGGYVARSPWRSATAVALLSVGLMASGGAVAVADPDSGASQGADGGVEFTSHDGAKRSGPIGSVTKAIRTTINGAVGALTPGHQSGPQSSATATDPAGIPHIGTDPRMLSVALRVPTPVN
jgi:hypothetical protein